MYDCIMNGKRILKFIIPLLIIVLVVGFIFDIPSLINYGKLILFATIILRYLWKSKRIQLIHISILIMFFVLELSYLVYDVITIKYRMMMGVFIYLMLFYFLYINHKSFVYNKRDVFTLLLGSSLYNYIF